LVAEAKEM